MLFYEFDAFVIALKIESTPLSRMDNPPGPYELRSFIIHKGSSVHCGHYIAYIKHEKYGWTVFNDDKVAKIEKPPFDQAYIYFYVLKK